MTAPRFTATTQAAASAEPVRVMVCDDSAVIRGLITRALEAESDIKVATSVANGQQAVNSLRRTDVDVIVLDIEMPEMDGLTALPLLLEQNPAVKVVMASTLTTRGAEVTLKAMQLGAADYVAKPSSTRDISGPTSFKSELIEKVRALGQQAKRHSRARPFSAAAGARPRTATSPIAPTAPAPAARVTTRPAATRAPEVIAIASSTGGPQALFQVIGALGPGLRQPILITQHMPATFTAILADHISRQCKVACAEAKNGEPVVNGRVYLAPGDYHMLVVSEGTTRKIRLTQDPPVNFCRPAADPMLASLAKVYGRGVLALVLTGMGQDGRDGCKAVVDAGGSVMAQDEATSVVWGMPGAVATAGLASQVLAVTEIGPAALRLAQR